MEEEIRDVKREEFDTGLLAFERVQAGTQGKLRTKLRKQAQVSWKWAIPERIEPKLQNTSTWLLTPESPN